MQIYAYIKVASLDMTALFNPFLFLILWVEFEEVSEHPDLIKRGPGNRGPSECGTTHEATSGMSS